MEKGNHITITEEVFIVLDILNWLKNGLLGKRMTAM